MTIEGAGLHRILRNTAETLSMQFYTDGAPADPGVTTIGIVNDAGSTVVAAGTAVGGSGTGPRTYALGAAQTANLDILTATWTTTNHGVQEQEIEIVGAHVFTIDEAQVFGDGALADVDTAEIERGRARITDEFERICGVSFIPRYTREVLDGRGSPCLLLAQHRVLTLRAIETRERGSQTWTAFTADELADVYVDEIGRIERESLGYFTPGRRNVRVTYEHGWAAPPEPVRRAALMAARYELINTDVSDRAISISNDIGTTQLWTPGYSGRGRAVHELPSVDKVLQEYNERTAGIG